MWEEMINTDVLYYLYDSGYIQNQIYMDLCFFSLSHLVSKHGCCRYWKELCFCSIWPFFNLHFFCYISSANFFCILVPRLFFTYMKHLVREKMNKI